MCKMLTRRYIYFHGYKTLDHLKCTIFVIVKEAKAVSSIWPKINLLGTALGQQQK
jgi:hypothetical protein